MGIPFGPGIFWGQASAASSGCAAPCAQLVGTDMVLGECLDVESIPWMPEERNLLSQVSVSSRLL